MDHPQPDRNRRLAWLVLAANSFSAVAIAFLHSLQPDLNPLERAISEYVHGPYGSLMLATFFSQSLGSLALGVSVLGERLKLKKALVGSVLLFVSAFGAAVAGIFPADLASPVPQTSAGAIHAAAGITRFLSLAIALPLISSALATHPRFQTVSKTLKLLATLFVVAFVVSIFVLANIGLFGLGQRCFIGILLIWMSIAAYPMLQTQDARPT